MGTTTEGELVFFSDTEEDETCVVGATFTEDEATCVEVASGAFEETAEECTAEEATDDVA